VDGVRQPLLGEDVGEVDQGAGETGDRDVVGEGAVLVVDGPGAVQGEALPRNAGAWCRYLDRLAAGQDSPQPARCAVTRERLLPARVNSSNEVGLARQSRVAYRVDAAVLRHQPAGLHASPDSLPRQSRLPYLLAFHDPVLPARQGLHHAVTGVWAV
jgi:hypothetical protein